MALLSLPMPGKRFVISVPYVWLFVFFLLPFLILLYISFVDMGSDISPFKPIWDPVTGVLSLKYENYLSIFRTAEGEPLFRTLYIEAYLRSIWYALLTAILCLVIGYPFAYFIARSPASVRPALLLMVMLPFWTSFLLRVYAWKGLLADNGVINRFWMAMGITSEPVQMLYTNVSMLVGMTYVYLPFMVLPLYATLVKMDFRLLEAAYDLGTTPLLFADLHAFRVLDLADRPALLMGADLLTRFRQVGLDYGRNRMIFSGLRRARPFAGYPTS